MRRYHLIALLLIDPFDSVPNNRSVCHVEFATHSVQFMKTYLLFSFCFFVLLQNMMSALPPSQLTYSCGGSNSLVCESMTFDPQLVYAQVIAEARLYAASLNPSEQQTPPPPKAKLRSSYRDPYDHQFHHRSRSVRVAPQEFCSSPDLQTSLEDLKVARSSWKASLLFWKRNKKNKSSSSSSNSSKRSRRSTCSSYSAPVVYTEHGGGGDDRDDMKIPSTQFRWKKPASWAYVAAGALSPGYKAGEARIPYVPLSHCTTGHSRFAPQEVAAQPMYLTA